MIGYLRGTVKQKRESSVVLECNGVGYEISVPKSIQFQFPEVEEQGTLHTHLHVRPESQALYGFLSEQERDMFRILINISSIGPSHALNILSELKLSELVTCVRFNDSKPLESVPRIGKATAAKLLIELANKIDQFQVADAATETKSGSSTDYLEDAVEALMVMGFTQREAQSAVSGVREQSNSTEQAIRFALGNLRSAG